jgi:hypothetical protein
MSMSDNGLVDLANAVRKYIIPKFAGGGYTQEEKDAITKNLEIAEGRSANKTPTGYANDVLEMIGLKGDSSMLLIVGVLVVAFIAIIKD